jgi:hypothetical protein
MLFLTAWLQTPPPAEAAQPGIGPYALIFMLLSMGAVTALTIWCYWRIMATRRHFDPDGTGPAHAPVPGEVEKGGGKGPRR